MQATNEQAIFGARDEGLLALNYATLAIVDELLLLPFPAVASAALTLLYGPAIEFPESLQAHVGTGMPASVASLLVGSAPLASLLPSRLGPALLWRGAAGDLKHARALARQRYRDLQESLMAGGRLSPVGADSLVRYTYGSQGLWSGREAARRILNRVVVLNRAALTLLVTREPSLSPTPFGNLSALPKHLPDRALAFLAEALPPIAVPDFSLLTERLTRSAPVLDGEESIDRYQSLVAVMLSFAGHQGDVLA